MNKKVVKTLLNEALAENESLFLVSFDLDKEGKIKIFIDGDNGVNLKECIRISRHIEHNLDEDEDFSLEVSSPNIADPIKEIRQYNKNIGRIVKVKTETEKYEGTLINVSDKAIELEWKAREPKPIGKGKITIQKNATIAFEKIIESKVKILF